MKHYLVRSAVLLLALAVPALASAQKDNKYTREAQKYIGLAMTKSDDAARADLYRQALTHLDEGLVREPDNAKIWMLAGQARAALNQFAGADSAFRRAQELHPEYAEDIAAERENAWVAAFNQGAEAMNAGDYPAAIASLELAQVMYAERPEGLMNLGVLYANANEPEKAAAAFEAARAAIQGPLAAKLNDEQKATWARFDEMARINLAQLAGQAGVDQFTAREFDAAVASFRKAAELNPHSRDYVFNLAQSIWAQASALEENLDSLPKPQQAERKQQLVPLYQELDKIAEHVLKMDPASELLYILRARSHRMIGEYAGSASAQKGEQDMALKFLEAREAIPIEITDIMVQAQDSAAVVRGTIKNRKLEAGATTSVTFTLVGIDGRVIGEQAITITAPAKDETASFEGQVPVEGEIAGWRYRLN